MITILHGWGDLSHFCFCCFSVMFKRKGCFTFLNVGAVLLSTVLTALSLSIAQGIELFGESVVRWRRVCTYFLDPEQQSDDSISQSTLGRVYPSLAHSAVSIHPWQLFCTLAFSVGCLRSGRLTFLLLFHCHGCSSTHRVEHGLPNLPRCAA